MEAADASFLDRREWTFPLHPYPETLFTKKVLDQQKLMLGCEARDENYCTNVY